MKKNTAFTEEEIAEMMREAQETKLVSQQSKVNEAEAKASIKTKNNTTSLTQDSWAYGVSRDEKGKYQVVEISFNAEKGSAKVERVLSKDTNKAVAGMKAEQETRRLVMSGSRKK